MRVPVEVERDADMVLHSAARRIRQLQKAVDGHGSAQVAGIALQSSCQAFLDNSMKASDGKALLAERASAIGASVTIHRCPHYL